MSDALALPFTCAPSGSCQCPCVYLALMEMLRANDALSYVVSSTVKLSDETLTLSFGVLTQSHIKFKSFSVQTRPRDDVALLATLALI